MKGIIATTKKKKENEQEMKSQDKIELTEEINGTSNFN